MKKVFLSVLLMFQALIAGEIYATFDVVSERSSELGLSLSGVVESLHVDVGDKAKKGDLLLSLVNAEEKNAYEIAKKNAEHAQKVYARYAKIADVIDKEKMDNYLYDKDIKALTAQSKEIVYKKTELRAPYDLVVTKKMTELGNIVLGSQTKLLTVESTHDIKLVLKFDEKYWQNVAVGQKFVYRVDGSEETYEGVISKIYPTILSSTREMQAEVKATNLLPGLFGQGNIIVE
ncbi:MAG: HlyD family efflux transporter periplasmic adaptor subunit [Campylobacterales bacterium]|nr:HlyD family efflux transporter periplasmic adaptor subunit [Campylobacterales bacterium]